MFSLIPGLPPYAIGITAQGQITANDFETTLLPALKKASAEWQGLNLLLVMKTDFKNFTAGAWLQDIKTNITYFTKWNKVAMVSNKESLDAMTSVFNFIVPGEAKTFSLEQVEEAKEWISKP